jgi:uncharacterized protein YoxC
MDNPLQIFYILLLLSASGLCIALIIYIHRITKSINEIQKDVKDLSSGIQPVLASTQVLTEKLNSIAENAKDQVDVVKSIVYDVRDRADTILEMEAEIRGKAESHLLDLLNTINAISNGITSFWNHYSKKEKSKNTISPSI